jgi:hypothetical protein
MARGKPIKPSSVAKEPWVRSIGAKPLSLNQSRELHAKMTDRSAAIARKQHSRVNFTISNSGYNARKL